MFSSTPRVVVANHILISITFLTLIKIHCKVKRARRGFDILKQVHIFVFHYVLLRVDPLHIVCILCR